MQGSFHHSNEIAKLDRHAVMRSAAEQPYPIRQALRGHPDRRNRRLPHGVWNREGRPGHIGLDVGHPDFVAMPRDALFVCVPFVMVDPCGEHHTAEILEVEKPGLVHHVPNRRAGDPGLAATERRQLLRVSR